MPNYSELASSLNETIIGSTGDDTITLTLQGTGLNTLVADLGNDTISSLGLSPGIVDGGAGADLFIFSGTVPTSPALSQRLVILLDVSPDDAIRVPSIRPLFAQSLFVLPDFAPQSYMAGYLPGFSSSSSTTGLLLLETTGDRHWDYAIGLGSSASGFTPPSLSSLTFQSDPTSPDGTTVIRLSPTGTGGATGDTVPGSVLTSAVIGVGASITGNIDPAANPDTDWFGIDLEAGTSYLFDLQGQSSGAGTLFDPHLTLYDSTGLPIAADDDGGSGFDSRLTFTPTSSGRHYLAAESPFSTGTYRLAAMATTAPAADLPGSALTTASLTSGAATVIGTIENAYDEDWYAIDLVAGQAYRFDLEGDDTRGGTLNDPVLTLRNSSGAVMGQDDNSGTGSNSRLGFVATVGGRYFVSAESPFGTGTYRLTAAGFDDVLGNASTAAVLVVGGSVGGAVDIPGDQDWYAIDLVAGRTYTFELKGADSRSGTLADPDLRLRNASGATIVVDNDGGTGLDSLVTFAATTSGRYYLSAAGGQGAGTYRLTATSTQASNPSEFLLQSTDGTLFGWDQTRGSGGFTNLGVLSSGATVQGVADFTGDGRADLLLSTADGQLQLRELAAGAPGPQTLQPFHGATLLAVGDFTGNSATDLLLRSAHGPLTFYDVAARATRAFITPAPEFYVVGTGDIDGAGGSDIVFQNSATGALLYWHGSGFRNLITLAPESGWHVLSVGDFVGGGAADFLFYNQNSRAMIFWEVAKGSQGFTDFIGLPQGVVFKGTADFNGDGRDDILMQQGGAARYWNGTQFVDVSTILSPGLELVGVGDIG
ncbi:MAG TPA: PPC domain-containing protein [Azospirillaceae bacterium]|nr:PPC domain-containing protein [Azospirillaceae bacterium]